MWMEFQGKKTTHDFLSLYNKDSSFQHHDSRPSPQDIYLKTHDFLKPLEDGEAATEINRTAPTERTAAVAHVLPGGIGTCSVSHVSGNGSAAAVKPERSTCTVGRGPGTERKPEPDNRNGSHASYTGVAFTLWEASVAKDTATQGQWSSPFAARSSGSFGSLSSSRNHSAHEKKRFMESASRSSRGFDDDDDDDDEFGKREGSFQKGELTVAVDRKNGDQRATTPRSKHSATEQRRRSKINDRFQILRDLIPHSDQKRDKASFLLEVIEYIRFLQEKVQKHESSYPEWNEENAKLMPWVKVYFRSFWKNARNNNQGPGDGIADPSQVMKNGSAPPGFIYSGKFDDNSIPVAAAMLSTAQNPAECDMSTGVSYKVIEKPTGFAIKAAAAPIPLQPNLYASVGRGAGVAQPQQRFIPDADNMASPSQSQWLRSSCPAECTVSSDMLNEQELTIDEGTISVSTAYSQGLLTTLTQALESSGIDLSQANINVQINLGKRASRRPIATTTMSSAKDLDDPSSGNRAAIGHSRVGSSGEESEQAPKRHRSDC